MKKLFFILILAPLWISCEKKVLSPENLIIGLWKPTNELQSLKSDGTWSNWTPKSELKSLPSYEFTKNGRFLLDGLYDESCCNPGSMYTVIETNLSFKYVNPPDCSTVKCADANSKTILSLTETELILLESSGRHRIKYERIR